MVDHKIINGTDYLPPTDGRRHPVCGSGDGKTDLALFRPDSPSSGLGMVYVAVGTNSYDSGQWRAPIFPFKDYDGDRGRLISLFSVHLTLLSTPTWFGYHGRSQMPCAGTPVSADLTERLCELRGKGRQCMEDHDAAKTSATITFQNATDPLSERHDGDGLVDIASWRPSDGTWYIRQSSKQHHRSITYRVILTQMTQSNSMGMDGISQSRLTTGDSK